MDLHICRNISRISPFRYLLHISIDIAGYFSAQGTGFLSFEAITNLYILALLPLGFISFLECNLNGYQLTNLWNAVIRGGGKNGKREICGMLNCFHLSLTVS